MESFGTLSMWLPCCSSYVFPKVFESNMLICPACFCPRLPSLEVFQCEATAGSGARTAETSSETAACRSQKCGMADDCVGLTAGSAYRTSREPCACVDTPADCKCAWSRDLASCVPGLFVAIDGLGLIVSVLLIANYAIYFCQYALVAYPLIFTLSLCGFFNFSHS